MNLVVLSYVIAVVGSFTALITVRDARQVSQENRKGEVFLAGLCLGGVGIWSMHFIGMLAFSMENMNMNYNWWLTFFSLVVGIVIAYIGLNLINQDEVSGARLISSGILVGLGGSSNALYKTRCIALGPKKQSSITFQ